MDVVTKHYLSHQFLSDFLAISIPAITKKKTTNHLRKLYIQLNGGIPLKIILNTKKTPTIAYKKNINVSVDEWSTKINFMAWMYEKNLADKKKI